MVEVLTSWPGRQARRCIFRAGLWSLIALSIVCPPRQLRAIQLTEAEITRIIKDVEVLPEQGRPRPATVKDLIRGGTAVRTGGDSKTELAFPDQTLTRLGSNTTFSFNEGTRTVELGAGALLLYAPKGSGGAKISTAAVTAAITGTTVMIEYHPPNKSKQSAVDPDGDAPANSVGWVSRKTKSGQLSSDFIKFITLEGIAHITLNTRPDKPILVPAGQMLMVSPDGSSVNMIEVNLAILVGSCPLIADFPPLGSAPLIADEIAKQQAEGPPSTAIDPDPTFLTTIDQALNGFPLTLGGGIAGSEFGPLNTITAPVPYIINSGTQIMTAPTITTNGVTSQGKIYRGQAADGNASLYFFGSQSTFDSDSNFNTLGEGGNNRIPMAAFKFTSLRIDGNPTITVPPGGANNLGLVSEGGITSGGAGSTLTFAGMNAVMLAAQAGSINLGASLAFDSVPTLFLYARGAGSNITLASPMTNMGIVELDAEGSVQINATSEMDLLTAFVGTDFLDGAGHVTFTAMTVRAGNNVTFTTNDYTNAAGPFEPNIDLFAGATLNFDVRTDSSVFANLSNLTGNGATISFTPDPGGSTVNLGGAFVSFTAGAGGVQAGLVNLVSPGNNIKIFSQGNITAASIVGGDSINSSGTITTTGALTSRDVEAFGNVSAGQLSALFLNQNFTPSNSTLTAGAGGITPYLPAGPGAGHRFNVATVQSPNGINFSGTNFTTLPGANGASLFLTAQSQIFGAGGIVGANFNGGDAGGPGQSPGGGGRLEVGTGGVLSVTGTTITATTGIIPTNDPPGGSGGTVNLTSSTGAVTVNNSQIQVSSRDPAGAVNRRSSARGGNINISSGTATGTAVNITSSAQLLSLLDNTAPGPGGVITINATSATGNSVITVDGTIRADKGGIDVRHSSDMGQINVSSNTLMADIIKIATLGDSSTLNINSGSNISAVTLLRLYAGSISPANNSTINFTGTINLSGAEIDIAAHIVNLVGAGTTVITSSQAHVYTDTPNYQGSGGIGGATTGTFGGAGATTLGLTQAPALGPPGGGAPALSAASLNSPALRSADVIKTRINSLERTPIRQDRGVSP